MSESSDDWQSADSPSASPRGESTTHAIAPLFCFSLFPATTFAITTQKRTSYYTFFFWLFWLGVRLRRRADDDSALPLNSMPADRVRSLVVFSFSVCSAFAYYFICEARMF